MHCIARPIQSYDLASIDSFAVGPFWIAHSEWLAFLQKRPFRQTFYRICVEMEKSLERGTFANICSHAQAHATRTTRDTARDKERERERDTTVRNNIWMEYNNSENDNTHHDHHEVCTVLFNVHSKVHQNLPHARARHPWNVQVSSVLYWLQQYNNGAHRNQQK